MKFLADPLFWLWLLVAGLGVASLRRNQRRLGLLLLAATLMASALEFCQVPARLLATLERPYLYKHSLLDAEEPNPSYKYDAVIVLGGYIEPFKFSYTGIELGDPADRIVTGVELIRKKNASVLVLGGSGEGNPPQPVEAQAVARWIQSWNVVPVTIEYLGVSSDTHDEAVHAVALAQQRGWTNVILVTSAWHLKRAEATFRKAGLQVVPVGSDFQGTLATKRPRNLVPRTKSLMLLRTWAEETIGFLYYRLRSWG